RARSRAPRRLAEIPRHPPEPAAPPRRRSPVKRPARERARQELAERGGQRLLTWAAEVDRSLGLSELDQALTATAARRAVLELLGDDGDRRDRGLARGDQRS